ncbi:MAG: response regulator [Candidatus Accumulibacter sp.]|jgi:PAS domain S-box-containing protein|nr:response regulator [Accumulibacter sp.]
MNLSHRDFRPRMLLAFLAVVVLVAAGAAVLRAIEKEYRRNIADLLASNLESMARGIALMQRDSVSRVRRIADEPRHQELVARLLADPREPSFHEAFRDWITPLYRSRGFVDYSLISVDGQRVITAGTRLYIGQEPLPSVRETLLRSELLLGGAVTPPLSAAHPFAALTVDNPSDYAYQLSCAPVERKWRLIAYLCLHENPMLSLYRLLRDGRPGMSGDAYVVDQQGRILSPIRFEKNLAAPEGAEPGWSLFQLEARVMPRRADGLADPARAGGEALTRVVARLFRFDALETGLVEDYADYRGRRVVGAGRWLQDAALGLIVEEDMDEAFRSLHFARRALVSLIALGVLLIVALTFVDWRSRRSLARSEQQMAAFRDYIPAGLSMKSADGRYLMTNPVFEASFHFPPGHVLGKTDAELFSFDEARELAAEHDAVMRTGQPSLRHYATREADGRERIFNTVRFPVREEKDGAIVAVGAVALDISELIRTQRDLEDLTQTLENKVAERTEQLAAARDMAEAANRVKAEFLANMSHEIRTPLNAIIGMNHLAVHANADARVGHYLERIGSSSEHLLGIVNDILDLSKIEAGKLVIAAAEFTLEALLDHVVSQVSGQAVAKGLPLRTAIAPALPGRLVGDAKRISQILINFANNAVKFTERGEISLRVIELGRDAERIRLRFEVEDSGIGIAEDRLPLLFRPFQQLDGSMSRQFEGSGLGLAISRNLAGLMDGAVGVSSRPGQGSVFSLELALRLGTSAQDAGTAGAVSFMPLMPPDPHRPAQGSGFAAPPPTVSKEAEEPEDWGLHGNSILLVEDNPINQEVVQGLLEMVGARVTVANDGAQGVRLLEDRSFDLVLMDVHTPNMDGFEATARIRKNPRFAQLPIVALTANALAGDLERCLAAGMDAYVAKPIQPKRLFAVLARYCRKDAAPESAAAAPEENDGNESRAPAASANASGDDELLARLAKIPEIDAEAAISRLLGRRDLYAQLVRRVAGEAPGLLQTLAKARRDGDRHTLAEAIHSAKSTLGLLGADALQQRCLELQQDFAEGTETDAGVGDFIAGLEAMLVQVSACG